MRRDEGDEERMKERKKEKEEEEEDCTQLKEDFPTYLVPHV